MMSLMQKISFYFILFFCFSCHGFEKKMKSKSENQNLTTTSVQWKDSIIHFGSFPTGDTLRIKFRYRNTGEKALIIRSVISSCSCTSIDYNTTQIAPGAESEIVALFDTKKSTTGYIRKTVVVTMNTKPINRFTLLYEGTITGHKQSTGL